LYSLGTPIESIRKKAFQKSKHLQPLISSTHVFRWSEYTDQHWLSTNKYPLYQTPKSHLQDAESIAQTHYFIFLERIEILSPEYFHKLVILLGFEHLTCP
jgi:hypothetical protein